VKSFQNILVTSENLEKQVDALKQALSLARNHSAELSAFAMYPELPKSLLSKKENIEEALKAQFKAQIEQSIAAVRDTLAIAPDAFPVTLHLESGDLTGVRIIQQVLRNNHDLLIKDAQQVKRGKGYKAIDMELLRKSPCPVWLCRPIEKSRQNIRVAVAIDPLSSEDVGHQLSISLLQRAQSLADTCNGKLDIVACWTYRYESYLRSNAFVKTDESQIDKEVAEAQSTHLEALNNLIRESGISGNNQIHHLKGKAEDTIPDFIETQQVDILVMGTVARTGIPGLIIGNTAENIVQNLNCSLLAMKPNGFVTPIKTY